jgi:glycosyltransferase involved in cell wall biosynthesis
MKNKKTIAILGEGYGASGKGLYVTKLFEKISKKMDLRLFLRDTTNYSGKNVIKIKTFKVRIRFLAGLGYYIPLFFYLLKHKEIKVIHTFDERIGFFMSFLKRPMIVTVHDIAPLYWGFFSNILFKILYKRLIKAEYIIVNSKNTGRMLKENFPFLSKKIKIIHLGTDLEKFKPEKKKKKKIITIGILGDLDSELKNVFKKIAKEYKKEVKIIIGGRIEQKEFDFLKSESNIIFKGFVKESELSSYYRSLDIFVYKKEGEGFGLIPLEAMASGCAAIVSNSASLPEVVEKGGILIENNEKEFYDALKKLIDDKELIEKYSKIGRKRAEKFPWSKCTDKTAEYYKKLFER